MLVQRLGFGPDVREALALHVRAVERERLSHGGEGRRDPARDARRAPEPRHGGDRPPRLTGRSHRRRSRSSRPDVRPGARRPVRGEREDVVRRAREAGAVGRRARPRTGTPPDPGGRRTRRGPHGGGRLHRPEVAVPGRPQPALRAARRRRRRAPRLPATTRSRRYRRAALVHEFGTTAIPNSIWDKPGPLTRAELDRVELHPMLTEQMLRRSPALAVLNPVAAAHHEKADGSGYHKGLRADAVDRGAHVLAAVDIYVGLTTERADRPAFSDRPGRGRAPPARVGGGARTAARSRRCSRQPATAKRPRIPSDAAPGRTQRSRGRGPEPRGAGAHDAGDRRTALHLAEDRRPSHPARLHEDRGLDASGRRPVGDATRRRSLIPVRSSPIDRLPLRRPCCPAPLRARGSARSEWLSAARAILWRWT